MTDMPVYDFGARLQDMRKRTGLSQKEVATIINKHVNTVAKYESNLLDPPIKVFKKLVLLYNTSADFIIGIEDNVMLNLNDISTGEQQILLNLYNQFLSKK